MPLTSPLTGALLPNAALVPNVVLRGLVQELLERHPELQSGAAFSNV